MNSTTITMPRKSPWAAAVLSLAALAGCGANPPATEIRSVPATVGGGGPARFSWGNVQVASPGSATCAPLSGAEVARALAETNAARAARGLRPLTTDARVLRIADSHACDMARRGFMSHKGSTTTGPLMRLRNAGYSARIVSENIGAGPFGLDRMVGEWNGSSAHLDNVLLSQARHFGIGRAFAADGKTAFWAAVYAAPMR